MGWEEGDTSPATKEYAWLKMMSAIKYDGYADFRAGIRFIENLAVWLKQFDESDRESAYQFFKSRLVYISPAEMQCLIDIFMPEVVTPNIRGLVAGEMRIKPYEVWATPEGGARFKSKLRRTLFMGMSDGSRIDVFRRANSGRISTEQVVATIAVDELKWKDLGDELVKAEGAGAKFESVYLIEDFTASGTTFIRKKDGIWKGKLEKFNEIVRSAKASLGNCFPLADNFALNIHHYVSSHQARQKLDELVGIAVMEWKEKTFGSVSITEGLKLPENLPLTKETDPEIWGLCDKYYDTQIDRKQEKHLKESGITTVRFGYAGCALPLILDHNTPNNSIPLLWAETSASPPEHAMFVQQCLQCNVPPSA